MFVFTLTILMLSDTGATASTAMSRNIMDPQVCATLRSKYDRKAEVVQYGHRFTIIGTATCLQDNGGPGRPGPPPGSVAPDVEVPFPFNQILPPAAFR